MSDDLRAYQVMLNHSIRTATNSISFIVTAVAPPDMYSGHRQLFLFVRLFFFFFFMIKMRFIIPFSSLYHSFGRMSDGSMPGPVGHRSRVPFLQTWRWASKSAVLIPSR